MFYKGSGFLNSNSDHLNFEVTASLSNKYHELYSSRINRGKILIVDVYYISHLVKLQ